MEVSVDRNQKDAKPQDCLSCKVLSSSALIIASLYVISIGMKARLRRTRIVSAAFATNLGYTGLARAMDWFPFNTDSRIEETVQNNS